MEVAGVVLGGLGLAALFEIGVECLSSFRSALHVEQEADDLLCKLDLEKMRLLVWGDQVGILKDRGRGRSPYLDSYEKEIRKSLEKVIKLFNDSEKLRDKYGVQKGSEERSTVWIRRDAFSRNGMRLFLSNILALKDRDRIAAGQLGPSSRAFWVLWDKKKFHGLLLEVREHINALSLLMNVAWSTVEHIIESHLVDAAFVGDVSRLKMVERACDETYGTLAQSTRTIISQSEAGSLDQRSEAELLEEQQLSFDTVMSPTTAFEPSRTFNTPWGAVLIFIVTQPCLRKTSQIPCQPNNIVQSAIRSGQDGWSSFALRSQGKNTLGRQIFSQLDLPYLLLTDADKILAIERASRDDPFSYPIAKVLIYCAPCVCQMHTAVQICWTEGLPNTVEYLVRVDDRLLCSCLDISERRQALLKLAVDMEPAERADVGFRSSICRHLDLAWLDQRAYDIESDGPMPSRSIGEQFRQIYEVPNTNPPCAAIVVLGEVDDMCQVMNQPPFPAQPRMPRATEVYSMSVTKRKYLGRFAEARREEGSLGNYI